MSRCTACNKILTPADLMKQSPVEDQLNDICAECRSEINEASYKLPDYNELSFHRPMGSQSSAEDIFDHISTHGSISVEED